jgi:hypothetical protein
LIPADCTRDRFGAEAGLLIKSDRVILFFSLSIPYATIIPKKKKDISINGWSHMNILQFQPAPEQKEPYIQIMWFGSKTE